MAGDSTLSRRGFLKVSAATSAAAGLVAGCEATAPPLPPEPARVAFDLTRNSGALQPDEVVRAACQFCNSLCGLKVHKKGGRIIDIQGETADPVQEGNLCVKGPMMAQIVYNPHRIRTPVRRVSGAKGSPDSRFEPIGWDQALAEIAKKLVEIRDSTGAAGVASKTSGRLVRGVGSIIGRFFDLYGSPNATDVGPVCNDAGGDALAWTFGLGNFTNGYAKDGITGQEDLGSSKFFLFFGTNQAETHPVTFEHLLRARARTGAKLVVVDPRQTPTSAFADQHIAIRPHTDMALVYAMLAHVIRQKLYDAAFVDKWVVGFDALVKHVEAQRFSPEWGERMTTVPASTIRALAEAYAKARPAAIFCNAGISHQMNAFHTYRAMAFLAAITGNVGRPGGGCNFMHNTWPGDLRLPKVRGEVPEKKGPGLLGPDVFPRAILDEDPYRLRAVFLMGNPLVDGANAVRVRAAYEKLELLVYPGLFLEEPALFADYVFPIPSVLEQECVYMRRDDRAIRWSDKAVDPIGEARPDIHLWIDLAHAMAEVDKKHPPSYWKDNLPAAWKDYRTLWDEVFVKNTPGMAGMTSKRLRERAEPLRWPCPSEDHPGTSTLYLDDPSWTTVASALGHAGKRFFTPSGKIEIHTPEIHEKLARAGHAALPPFYSHPEVGAGVPTVVHLAEKVPNPLHPGSSTPRVKLGVPPNEAARAGFPLLGMIGRPSVVDFATMTQWTNTGKMMNGLRLVQIHPRAAARAGIRDRDAIRVESPRGVITATALLFDGIREDTIFVPNFFGPAQKVGDDLGLPRYEPANVLVDDGHFDALSGQQAYKCFACRVVRA
ncbi:molybdopterin-dependent oxidoreductase [Polyangium mundeleinium]|uniref:Molybdopterin-dependent oxidoreductase n=1 Tax=Polyangium mundeleinium TaxID=2995306 RepID=A0ABT5EQQ8_9BACT|nr:molybdopterin-dependent oxidoreductase [Polyangium mundeleinium]MDC0744096.1 molybdopterin-dependent oxidoreductase [Polyangium mundeleinium]